MYNIHACNSFHPNIKDFLQFVDFYAKMSVHFRPPRNSILCNMTTYMQFASLFDKDEVFLKDR